MKLNEANVYWSPGHDCYVGPYPSPDNLYYDSRRFQCVMGACNSNVHTMTAKERRAECIRLYVWMTIEGVPALQVYKQMYKISDFRDVVEDFNLDWGNPGTVAKYVENYSKSAAEARQKDAA